jgi:hypothetical protein
MSIRAKDGAMIALAVSGVLALTATAEFGLPAAAIGAALSLISGAIAIHGNADRPSRVDIAPSVQQRESSAHRSMPDSGQEKQKSAELTHV